MTYKTRLLKGLGKTNTSLEKYDSIMTPTGKTRTLLEVRPYFSRTHKDVEIEIKVQTEVFLTHNSAIHSQNERGVPMNCTAEAGEEIILDGKTDGVATDFIVMVIYDET